VDGQIKLNNPPTLSEFFKAPVTLPKTSLEVDLKPIVDMTHYLTLGADMRWLASGVGIEARLRATVPTKFDVLLDRPENTLSIKTYIPKKVR